MQATLSPRPGLDNNASRHLPEQSLVRIAPFLLILSALLRPIKVYGWINGELSIWMDGERAKAVQAIARKFQADPGLKVSIESPDNTTIVFRLLLRLARDQI